jgi:membrane-associated protease RseP (regulator of RpoE activity)
MTIFLAGYWGAVVAEEPSREEKNSGRRQGVLGIVLDRDLEGRPLIVQVSKGGAAERAGILPGDLIVRLGDKDMNSSHEVVQRLGARVPMEEVEIVLEREEEGGRTARLTKRVMLRPAKGDEEDRYQGTAVFVFHQGDRPQPQMRVWSGGEVFDWKEGAFHKKEAPGLTAVTITIGERGLLSVQKELGLSVKVEGVAVEDPKDLIKKQEEECATLKEAYGCAGAQEERDRIRRQIRDNLNFILALEQMQRGQLLRSLERQIGDLQKQLQEREAQREEILEDRLDRFLKEDPLRDGKERMR